MSENAREDAYGFTLCWPDLWERAHRAVRLDPARKRTLLLRAFLPALLVWLPLVILALVRGGDDPFLRDIVFHVRFLLVVPLLVLAEPVIDRQTKLVAIRLATTGFIPPEEEPKFAAIVLKSVALVRSIVVQVVLVLLAAGLLWVSVTTLLHDGIFEWFEQGTATDSRLGPVGWWYAAGSVIPLFLLLRWMWRYGVWTYFLLRVSRLRLDLLPTHPDKSAGLAFIGIGHASFSLIAGAESAMVAAVVGMRILNTGVALESFKFALPAVIMLILLIAAAPLLVFAIPLARARREGLHVHGSFANRFVADFNRKAYRPAEGSDAPDIQSLADIGASFERIEEMRMVPIDLRGMKSFLIAVALPMLVLVATTVPTKDLIELLKRVMG